jgi:hypothetical protein
MKRHGFAFLSFVLLFLPIFNESSYAQSNSVVAINDNDIPDLLPSFYQLWKDSAFGNDPNRTERAAWIIRKDDGSLGFHRWRRSGAWAREIWVGPLPENIVGQAHTHPAKRDPMPSPKDKSLSQNTNLPLYTISERGIWRVTPDGKLTKIAGNNWYIELRKSSSQLDFPQTEPKGEQP